MSGGLGSGSWNDTELDFPPEFLPLYQQWLAHKNSARADQPVNPAAIIAAAAASGHVDTSTWAALGIGKPTLGPLAKAGQNEVPIQQSESPLTWRRGQEPAWNIAKAQTFQASALGLKSAMKKPNLGTESSSKDVHSLNKWDLNSVKDAFDIDGKHIPPHLARGFPGSASSAGSALQSSFSASASTPVAAGAPGAASSLPPGYSPGSSSGFPGTSYNPWDRSSLPASSLTLDGSSCQEVFFVLPVQVENIKTDAHLQPSHTGARISMALWEKVKTPLMPCKDDATAQAVQTSFPIRVRGRTNLNVRLEGIPLVINNVMVFEGQTPVEALVLGIDIMHAVGIIWDIATSQISALPGRVAPRQMLISERLTGCQPTKEMLSMQASSSLHRYQDSWNSAMSSLRAAVPGDSSWSSQRKEHGLDSRDRHDSRNDRSPVSGYSDRSSFLDRRREFDSDLPSRRDHSPLSSSSGSRRDWRHDRSPPFSSYSSRRDRSPVSHSSRRDRSPVLTSRRERSPVSSSRFDSLRNSRSSRDWSLERRSRSPRRSYKSPSRSPVRNFTRARSPAYRAYSPVNNRHDRDKSRRSPNRDTECSSRSSHNKGNLSSRHTRANRTENNKESSKSHSSGSLKCTKNTTKRSRSPVVEIDLTKSSAPSTSSRSANERNASSRYHGSNLKPISQETNTDEKNSKTDKNIHDTEKSHNSLKKSSTSSRSASTKSKSEEKPDSSKSTSENKNAVENKRTKEKSSGQLDQESGKKSNESSSLSTRKSDVGNGKRKHLSPPEISQKNKKHSSTTAAKSKQVSASCKHKAGKASDKDGDKSINTEDVPLTEPLDTSVGAEEPTNNEEENLNGKESDGVLELSSDDENVKSEVNEDKKKHIAVIELEDISTSEDEHELEDVSSASNCEMLDDVSDTELPCSDSELKPRKEKVRHAPNEKAGEEATIEKSQMGNGVIGEKIGEGVNEVTGEGKEEHETNDDVTEVVEDEEEANNDATKEGDEEDGNYLVMEEEEEEEEATNDVKGEDVEEEEDANNNLAEEEEEEEEEEDGEGTNDLIVKEEVGSDGVIGEEQEATEEPNDQDYESQGITESDLIEGSSEQIPVEEEEVDDLQEDVGEQTVTAPNEENTDEVKDANEEENDEEMPEEESVSGNPDELSSNIHPSSEVELSNAEDNEPDSCGDVNTEQEQLTADSELPDSVGESVGDNDAVNELGDAVENVIVTRNKTPKKVVKVVKKSSSSPKKAPVVKKVLRTRRVVQKK